MTAVAGAHTGRNTAHHTRQHDNSLNIYFNKKNLFRVFTFISVYLSGTYDTINSVCNPFEEGQRGTHNLFMEKVIKAQGKNNYSDK